MCESYVNEHAHWWWYPHRRDSCKHLHRSINTFGNLTAQISSGSKRMLRRCRYYRRPVRIPTVLAEWLYRSANTNISVGALAAGAVANLSVSGWRYIFWIQVGLHGLTSLGFFAVYWPKKRTDYPRMSAKEWLWACDPIGSVLLISSATLMLLALNWAGGSYPWSSPHVCANLVIGIVLFIAFCSYGTYRH